MEILALFMFVAPMVTSITVSSNGNSPEVKMIGGMMVDMQQGFMPSTPRIQPAEMSRKMVIEKDVKLKSNSTLSINERYRRLIPYMTFYYANDLVSRKPEFPQNNVEVEKVELVEHVTQPPQRHPKILYSHNIPRYQGNRLTQYNIASANPPKYYYKAAPPPYQHIEKYTTNQGQHNIYQDYDRPLNKPHKVPNSPFVPSQTRKPYHANYNLEDLDNIQYYVGEKPYTPKYKLVPYQQTPPVTIAQHQNENFVPSKRFPVQVPVHVPKENVVIKPRPIPPQYYYETVSNVPQTSLRKQPVVVSENYYDRRHPAITRPVIEGGFKPIINTPVYTTESILYSTSAKPEYNEDEKYETVQVLDAPVSPAVLPEDSRDAYQSKYFPQSNRVSLTELINALQYNRTIPKTITKENVGSSIRTLLHVLNALKAYPEQENNVEVPVLSTPKPFVTPRVVVEVTPQPIVTTPSVVDNDIHSEPYLAHVTTPSQHLDDYPSKTTFGVGSTSQRFPLLVTSDEEGGTPGHPGKDYPTMTTIPPTSFNCKTQRYKGFFADPETRCQVWHYCDLNGGQASFLCPNGTIFSQAALTCDWWFNVKCDSTTQLYVLNESLYKFILPHSPKFPEDYSGPLVDKYLTLKFKEMEEQFKKNKNKVAADKSDSDETETEASTETDSTEEGTTKFEIKTVSESSVVVQSPGNSGAVQRLQDELNV